MAQKIVVQLTCDLCEDNSEAAETTSFGFAGQDYELELCEKHLAAFNETLGTYAGLARRPSLSRRRRPPSGSTPPATAPRRTDKDRLADIRAWAKKKGLKVSDRGRIPISVVAQFDAAHRK